MRRGGDSLRLSGDRSTTSPKTEGKVKCVYPDGGVGSVLQQTFDGTQTEVGGSDVESCTVVEITTCGVQHCGDNKGGVILK